MTTPEIVELASMHAFTPLWRRMICVYDERVNALLRDHGDAEEPGTPEDTERERRQFVRLLNRYNRKIAMYTDMLTRLERDTGRLCRNHHLTMEQFADIASGADQSSGAPGVQPSPRNA
jgi:hypothetical protein